MAISDFEFASTLSKEKTLLDQAFTMSCLVYHQVLLELVEDPGDDKFAIPSAQHLGRFNNALLNIVHFGDMKARSEGLPLEDPETAWADAARKRFRRLGRNIVEMRGIEGNNLLSEESADQQRNLYRGIRSVQSGDLEGWDRPSVRPTSGPIV